MYPSEARILIVDDVKSLRDLLRAYLHRLGYHAIDEAQDGFVAWDMTMQAASRGYPYDVVISDWNMPHMTGVEFLKRVRATPALKDLPFILLTTESEKAKVIEAVSGGVSNYMVKPVTEDVLKDKLSKVYEKHTKSKKA